MSGSSTSTPIWSATAACHLEDAHQELDSGRSWALERNAEPLQQVGLDAACGPVADGIGERRDMARSGEQYAGKADDPLAAILGRPVDQLLEHDSLQGGAR
jgi:hypothetical protein